MADLTEKLEGLERQLVKLSHAFNRIRKSFTNEHPKPRQLVHTKFPGGRPEWVEEIVRQLNEISADIKSVKKTLDVRSNTDKGNSPSDASEANHGAEAELQRDASSPSRSERVQVSSMISESSQQDSVPRVAPEQVEHAYFPSLPGQNIVVSELASQTQNLKAPLAEVPGSQRACVALDKVKFVKPKVIPSKRKAVFADTQARKTAITPEMGTLLDAVCGEEAFHHMCALIYGWRGRSNPLFDNTDGRAPAVHLVKTLSALEKRSHLNEFLDRFAKVKLAEVIDGRKDGRVRADTVTITNLLNDLRWENNRTNRTKLNNYLQEGRRWKRICGSFEGLLCLVPPNRGDKEKFRISGRVFQELSDEDISVFHSLLARNAFIQRLCYIGQTLQISIWSGTEVPKFRWESEDANEIARLSMKELAPFIEKFTATTENY